MHAFARMPVMDVARFQVHRLQRITPVSQVLRKAERATPLYNQEHLTELPKATSKNALPPHRIFVENKPLQYRLNRRQGAADSRFAQPVPRNSVARAAALLRSVPAARCRLPGGGHGQRWVARLHRLSGRQRQRRSTLSADQGGA